VEVTVDVVLVNAVIVEGVNHVLVENSVIGTYVEYELVTAPWTVEE
jgi:hypothetical protein